jgi:plastocyanin
MKTVRMFSMFAVVSGSLLFVSCGDEENPNEEPQVTITEVTGEEAADATTPTVHMPGFVFMPASVTIKKGGSILFKNDGTMLHTVTSGTGSADPRVGKLFDKALAVGKTFKFTFKTVGTQAYYCRPHEALGMKATITVTP